MTEQMIANRIQKTSMVRWRQLQWLQGGLKKIDAEAFQKLKRSLTQNSFVQPFNIWQDGKTHWILDGHNRKRAMEELEQEGWKIPDVLPANFIRCESRKQGAKLVLLYSSIYANVTRNGLVLD